MTGENSCSRCQKAADCTRWCGTKKGYQNQAGKRHGAISVIREDTCVYCRKPIVWIMGSRGGMQCLDKEYIAYKESKQGKDILISDSGEKIRCNVIREDKNKPRIWPTGMARRQHWLTCEVGNRKESNHDENEAAIRTEA